jgi:hypothetical protein
MNDYLAIPRPDWTRRAVLKAAGSTAPVVAAASLALPRPQSAVSEGNLRLISTLRCSTTRGEPGRKPYVVLTMFLGEAQAMIPASDHRANRTGRADCDSGGSASPAAGTRSSRRAEV